MNKVIFQARRWITQYGVYRHDVKVEHPPRVTPKLWRLPVHRKLLYVSPGWYYRKKEASDDRGVKTTVSCLSVVKSGSNKLLESFTKEEFNFLIENKDQILAEFDRVEKQKDDDEERDRMAEHVCR